MNTPNVKLSGIEYLLVCIQSNPGQSQRYYLRRLYTYRHGKPDHHNGGSSCGYFTSKSYRDVLWHDAAAKDSIARTWLGSKPKSHCGQMHLTPAGNRRANKARQKLGLKSIPYKARSIFIN